MPHIFIYILLSYTISYESTIKKLYAMMHGAFQLVIKQFPPHL